MERSKGLGEELFCFLCNLRGCSAGLEANGRNAVHFGGGEGEVEVAKNEGEWNSYGVWGLRFPPGADSNRPRRRDTDEGCSDIF